MSDSGTIFKAGTTDAIAEVIHAAFECGDTAKAARRAR